MLNLLYYILIIIGLSGLTNLIVWSKIFGYIKSYLGIGMLDKESIFQQIVNCNDCLSIWIGITSIPIIVLLNIVPFYICLITPLLVNFCVNIVYK